MTGSPVIAALYVEKNGVYANLPGIDPWPEDRDARLYEGPWPVVAHPPCERWHQLSAVNAKRWGWRINDDEGCFAAALGAVRRFGGVLEHPAESRAFRFHGIPEPVSDQWQLTVDGDWVVEVWQSAYGHRARKRTWLLYHGDCPPPPLNWKRRAGEFQIGNFDPKLPQLPAAERAATPVEFRDLLIAIVTNGPTSVAAPVRASGFAGECEVLVHASKVSVEPGQCRTKKTAEIFGEIPA